MKSNLKNVSEHERAKKLVDEFEIKKDPDGVRVINGTRYIGMIPEDEWLKHCKKRDKEFLFTRIAIWVGVIFICIVLIFIVMFLLSWIKNLFF